VTGTRAEYGLLKPFILRCLAQKDFETRVVVTGAHLCHDFGYTYNEIVDDGIPIDHKIEMVLSSDTPEGMAKSTGLAIISFSDYFSNRRPDLLVALGDRYELLACASAAALIGIPVAHIHGGERTSGVVDEFIRHSITKMSTIHFTCCETYRKRVIQMGEQPHCVFNTGALGVENVYSTNLIPLDGLEFDPGFSLNDKAYAVVTFHPLTLESGTGIKQLRELMTALDAFEDMRFVITKANSDAGGREINHLWDEYATLRNNCLCVASLGMVRYLSLIKHASAIIGNSSSGIIEGPAIKTPTVNIGDRQKGRVMAESVICCDPVSEDIIAAVKRAVSPEFYKQNVLDVENPYGDGKASVAMIEAIRSFFLRGAEVKKEFYDLSFDVL